jgi:hypothetical protein
MTAMLRRPKRDRYSYRVECDRCDYGSTSNMPHAGESCPRKECGGTLRPYVYKGQVARLRITSWTYIGSLGARHYYGKVTFRDEEYELSWRITAEEARLLNKGDRFDTYKRGDKSTRFVSTEQLEEAARKLFKEKLHGMGCLILLEKDSEPARPVAFDADQAEAAARLTALYDEFKAVGGYEGDEQRAEEIYDECREVMKQWQED